nr:hypothetical protein [Chloroflexota bacterium]
MQNRQLLEMLAIHEDLLDGNASRQSEYERMSEEERKELLPLVELVQQVGKALAPVKPSASFRQRLELELIGAAHQRMHREVHIAPLAPRRDVLVGAAVGSVVALAGGVVYLVHNWIRSRSEHVERVSM